MMLRPCLLACSLTAGLAAAAMAQPEDQRVQFFEKKVRPILVDHCYHCHSADTKPAGGLRVDDRNGLLTGGNTGPAVVPGEPVKSLLLRRVTAKGKKGFMPAAGKALDEEQIATLTTWITEGAAWPSVRVAASLGKGNAGYGKLRAEHWAWQPIRNANPPEIIDRAWPKDDIDRFVLAKLESKNLKPVRDADSATLLRRITFDLTGLPPTPVEIAAFVTESASNPESAFEKVVDRLLASPRFGERWGRHWLDVARYGESTGPSRNIPYPHAWKYRDYVIDAVNTDVPFNRFIQEQIAGDLLPADSDSERDRLKIATGFLALGVKDVNQRFKVRFIMDNVDEQIDVVARSFLALTVSCARCHDHKFDPVPMTDYYALAGIFTSTENAAGLRNLMGGGGLAYYVPDQLIRLTDTLPPPPAEQLEKLKVEVAEAKKAWDAIRGTPEGLKLAANGLPTQRPFCLKYEKLHSELMALTDPVQRGFAAHGVRDAKNIADTQIRIRGEAEQLGPVVGRGYPTAFNVPDAKPVDPKQSGRLQLAQWLTNQKNPLAPRVAVNRVWSHLFGRGLVSTPDNFGVNGDKPSHPQLLDYLAQRFIHDGWSTKRLVRALVLTRSYRLSAEATDAHRKLDPGNVLIWRHAPRRLEAEEVRDATLAAAGALNLDRPNGSPANKLRMVEVRDNGPEAKTLREAAEKSPHRSVYLPLLRGITPLALQAFDPVEQTLVTGSRDVTTVPGQALFMLNSSFIRKQSLALATKLLKDEPTDSVRLQKAYLLTLGRSAGDAEIERAKKFLSEYESIYRDYVASHPPAQPSAKPKTNASTEAANPDEADQTGEPIIEDLVRPTDPRVAAWLAYVQALLGSAEFRYVN